MDDIPADIWKTAQAYFDAPLQPGYCTTIARAIMAERERCAKIADEYDTGWTRFGPNIAAAIRTQQQPNAAIAEAASEAIGNRRA